MKRLEMARRAEPPRRPPALRRSWLFTAGLDDSAQRAALAAGADVIVADLEEFTAAADRPAARPRVAELMRRCRAHGVVGAVRVNRLSADGRLDLEGVMAGAPDVVFLPHVDADADVAALARALDALEAAHGVPPGATEIVPTIESALGLVRMQSILAASGRVSACLLAAEDLTADLGAERGPDSLELNHLRGRFLVECRAAARVAIDCPFNYRDPAALAADLAWARRLGFRAKCTVHPDQVAAVHAALTPGGEAIERARETVARFEAARRGEAVAGPPVEGPDHHTARRLLARADEFRRWADASSGPPPTGDET